jgi:hypothetical protein
LELLREVGVIGPFSTSSNSYSSSSFLQVGKHVLLLLQLLLIQ